MSLGLEVPEARQAFQAVANVSAAPGFAVRATARSFQLEFPVPHLAALLQTGKPTAQQNLRPLRSELDMS